MPWILHITYRCSMDIYDCVLLNTHQDDACQSHGSHADNSGMKEEEEDDMDSHGGGDDESRIYSLDGLNHDVNAADDDGVLELVHIDLSHDCDYGIEGWLDPYDGDSYACKWILSQYCLYVDKSLNLNLTTLAQSLLVGVRRCF